MPSLPDKIVALHRALEADDLAHAFGGALALAYCTEEPRGTRDIDVNVFITPSHLDELAAALPPEVSLTTANRTSLRRDAQTRAWWDETPVDLFLSNHPFHDHAEANRRHVPFAGLPRLPVLACDDLAVFKTFFARPKDVVDVATMVAVGTVDLGSLEMSVDALLGTTDRREFLALVAEAVSRM